MSAVKKEKAGKSFAHREKERMGVIVDVGEKKPKIRDAISLYTINDPYVMGRKKGRERLVGEGGEHRGHCGL